MLYEDMRSGAIFDVLYGFVPITEWEQKIIDSPYFQRLRWIRQLGFSSYIFPGADHSRFSHAIGVMHSLEQMVRALGIGVSENELFDSKTKSKEAMLHKCLRVAAMLHDIGTFPFSHVVEYAYLSHGIDRRRDPKHKKELPNSHEHLGSFIIKNTQHEGGITAVLEKYDLDVALVSKIIKGTSPYLIANQLLHSDLDADRMDYLLRDGHFTGIKYGQFDRDYILANLMVFSASRGQQGFGVAEGAIRAVEDFLIARFNWYSQVIRNPDSAKFDVMAGAIAKAFLERDLMYQFDDLLTMIDERDERFYWWNDNTFLTRCQEARSKNQPRDARTFDLIERLLLRKPPKTLEHPLFKHRILHGKEGLKERERLTSRIEGLAERFSQTIEKSGRKDAWILLDLPKKDVTFTSALTGIVKNRGSDNLYLERDPVKLVAHDGKPSLLVERDDSLMQHLSSVLYFAPCAYASDSALEVLDSKGLLNV